MIEIQAPMNVDEPLDCYSIFLAGSIEMGNAEPWQDRFCQLLSDQKKLIAYNPRRDDWDSSWEQSITNEKFKEQVTWELDHITEVNLVCFYFDSNTKSPITLMELGLVANDRPAVVCCPKSFWRSGNVDVICERYDIAQVETLEEMADFVRKAYKEHEPILRKLSEMLS